MSLCGRHYLLLYISKEETKDISLFSHRGNRALLSYYLLVPRQRPCPPGFFTDG